MTTRTTILNAILAVLPSARPDARIIVEQPLQPGGRDTWTGTAAPFADRIAAAIEEGKNTLTGESTPAMSIRDARTTVLVAVARALREQPTGARLLDGLGELGEAVVCAELGEIAEWADALASLAHIDDALGNAAAQPLVVYRAEYNPEFPIPVGLYTAEADARRHCEALVSDEHPADRSLAFDWIGDEDDPEEPSELVFQVDGGDEEPTGYVVVPIVVATAYTSDAE